MPSMTRRHWRPLAVLVLILLALGFGYTQLAYKERELLYSIEPGTAGWFTGVPAGVQQMNIALDHSQFLHAWWWPAPQKKAPTVLYLHGTRWNLTAQVRRITELRNLGFSVLAIDYRGFGDSPGGLPSEARVYEDAQAAWQRLVQLQPIAQKRYIYGHSLGGAIAVDLAQRIASKEAPPAAGLIIESTFTDLGDAAAAVIHTSLPVRWIMSEKFDSIDKISAIGMPVLIVHGMADPYVPPRFSQALYDAASNPKQLLLVPGGTHLNSMTLGSADYARALHQLFGLNPTQGAG